MENNKKYPKLQITGIIKIETGLHIGDSTEFAAIGDVDSPVIKDSLSGLPIIPGSSFKGKMRTLLARECNDKFAKYPNQDNLRILRMFGCSNPIRRSRLIFRDTVLSDKTMEELKKYNIYSPTEVKFENSIDRMKGRATPRQIERVIRGAEFEFSIIYDVEESDEVLEDMEMLKEGFILLQYDYLGGNGSRGYGKIKIYDIDVNSVVGETDKLDECRKVLKEAEVKEEV